MGDYFQTIVDLDATPAEASTLAGCALDWLVREGIVRREQTACVFGVPSGNPPGEHWAKAVAQPDWEPTDGLAIETGPTVFYGGQGDAQYATCPQCAGRTDFYTDAWEEVEGAWQPFRHAIDAWQETGEATVGCRHCRAVCDLRAWTWADDYFAFGHLGFTFWNWPDFGPRFLTDFARTLGGHHVVEIGGKL